MSELTAIRLDVAGIVARVHNALKLSGDLYLAKVYTRTAGAPRARRMEESVGGKLDVLEQIHNLLAERVTTARAEALEVTIVVLIAHRDRAAPSPAGVRRRRDHATRAARGRSARHGRGWPATRAPPSPGGRQTARTASRTTTASRPSASASWTVQRTQ